MAGTPTNRSSVVDAGLSEMLSRQDSSSVAAREATPFGVPAKVTEDAITERAPEENCVFIVQGKIALEAVEDKIIIMLDPFKTGYECKTCDGTGYELPCSCVSGVDRFLQACKKCGGDPNAFAGKECRDCNGIGSLILVPESAKSLPTSGRIVSMGPGCKKGADGQYITKVGQRYLFGIHVGYFLPFKGNILLRCMREHEVLCRVYSLERNIAMGDHFAVQDSNAAMG